MTTINLAIWYLNFILLNGPVPAQEILSTGKQLGLSKRTLQRAKKALGIKSIKSSKTFTQGIQGWVWSK